jgi:hypothetical protein
MLEQRRLQNQPPVASAWSSSGWTIECPEQAGYR